METPKSSSNHNIPSKWCHLPRDELLCILQYLDYKTYLPCLRSVCSAWRSALPPSIVDPQSIQVPPFNNVPLNLLQSHFYLFSPLASDDSRSLGGRWLARMHKFGHNDNNSNQWHLLNPFNFKDYFNSEPHITGSLNLLDCRVLELAAPFFLVRDDDVAKPISKKVVIARGCNFGYAVLAHLHTSNEEELLLWKAGETEWTRVEVISPSPENILDIASHNGKFYVLQYCGWQVGVIDPSSCSKAMEYIPAPNIWGYLDGEAPMVGTFHGHSCYFNGCDFVLSNGMFYLVIKVIVDDEISSHGFKRKRNVMIIFVLKKLEEMDEQGQNGQRSCWEQVESLGDQIFFIGYDVTFSLPASSVNLPQWKSSSICLFTCFEEYDYDMVVYKTKDLLKGYESLNCLKSLSYPDYRFCFELFDMEEGEKSSVVGFEDLSEQVYTKLFFPPPAWVEWHCPSLGTTEVRLDRLRWSPTIYNVLSFVEQRNGGCL